MGIVSVQSKIDERGFSIASLSVGMMEAFHAAVDGTALGAMAEWERIASQRLRSARQIYINGLRQSESYKMEIVAGRVNYTLTLMGEMPNNFEFGMPSFDMKVIRPGWLGGMRAKTGKDGKKYVTIPFRHSTTSGAIMSYTGKAKRENVAQSLQYAVRKYGLREMVRNSGGNIVRGTVTKIPAGATDVHRFLTGLQRIQTPTAGVTPSGLQKGTSQLVTFRRMSENSPPESWIHPGIRAVNILPDVERWIDYELDHILDRIFIP